MKDLIQKGLLTAGVLLLLTGVAYGEPLRVTVSILPLKYFVEKIGGDMVQVSVMVEPGADMHTYEPKPQQMTRLAASKLYFAVGADFERAWLRKIALSNKSMRIVRLEEGVPRQPMLAHHGYEDEHDHGHGHDRDEILDPHVWLSPPLVRVMAQSIRDALMETDSAHAGAYRVNYLQFAEEINRADSQITGLLKKKIGKGNRFMVYHPAWGYFAATYGLDQVPVEIEGKEPSPRELVALIRRARSEAIGVVFVQPQFSDKSAQTIAGEIGGRVVRADPLAYNWSENLVAVARQIAEALK